MIALPFSTAALPPWRQALPEIMAGGVVLASACLVLLKDPGWHRFVLGIAYLTVLAVVAVQDFRTRRALNKLVAPALALAIPASLSLGVSAGMEALLGGAIAFAALLVLAAVGRGALGIGDVKLGALCGVVVGAHGVVPMLAVAFIGGGAVAVVLLALRVANRKDSVAFTPFLGAATAVSLGFFPLYLAP